MKRILLIFIISVLAIFILNRIVYTEVPEKIKKEQLSEVLRYKSPIKSISINQNEFEDLKVLDSALKGNRVIMLGENRHSDAETFKAKSRLIKYLHEHLGYNVVLYEAGQYDNWIMNEEMNSHKMKISKDSVGGLGLFYFWWDNEETKPLLSYYQKTKASENPIEIGGFDIQFSGDLLYGKRRAELLKSFFERNKINLKQFPVLNKHLENLDILANKWILNKYLNPSQQKQLLNEISKAEQIILKLSKSRENIIYSRYFNDIRNNFLKSWKYEAGSLPSMQFRDSLMAKNLIYQIDSVYKDQKIIVWCANIHTFSARYNKNYTPLGTYIKKKYGKSSYMLDFSSYAVSNGQNILDKPGNLAVENIFHKVKIPYFFIDLRKIPQSSFLKKEFVSTINQGIDEKRKWSDLIDGIFYIDINKNPTYPKK